MATLVWNCSNISPANGESAPPHTRQHLPRPSTELAISMNSVLGHSQERLSGTQFKDPEDARVSIHSSFIHFTSVSATEDKWMG